MSKDLWQVFERTANQFGDRNAIVQADRRLTFSELRHRALSIAAWLTDRGLKRHDRVLLWLENSPEAVAAMLGVWAARGIPAMLDVSSSPPVHFQHAIESVQPKFVLCAGPGTTLDEACPVASVTVEAIPEITQQVDLRSPALPTDPASIVFTSGSTGPPKGVVQSHGNLIRACRTVGRYLGLTAADRILCPVSFSSDYGYGQLLSAMALGAVLVLPEKLNAFAVCEAIEEHRPTVLPDISNNFAYYFRGISPFRQLDLSPLRIVSNTGGRIPAPVLEEMMDAFGHCRLFLNYGLTESYRTSYLPPELVRERPTSIGKAIPGVDVVIMRDDGTPAGPDEEGEIVHRGDYLFLGYWNQPVATAMALQPDPLMPSACPHAKPALFTGDYGHMDADGFLYFHGRRDRMLKSMGVRVSPGEVEDILLKSGLVREAAVFGIQHDVINDEVCAAIVPAPGAEDVERSLKEYARTGMSKYMTPRRYLIYDSLPRTHTSKTDYHTLQQEASRPDSAKTACGSSIGFDRIARPF